MENEEFLNYLRYLEYWRKPEYAKHLVYPNCLHVLTLLQSESFRQHILRQDAAAVLMNDMVHRWKEPQTTFAATPLQNLVKPEVNGEAVEEGEEEEQLEHENGSVMANGNIDNGNDHGDDNGTENGNGNGSTSHQDGTPALESNASTVMSPTISTEQ